MHPRLVAAALFLVVATLYAGTLGDYLVWTDFFEIGQHHMLAADASTLHALWLPDQLRGENYYRPVQALVNTLDWVVWHERWWGFHLTNVLLHAGVTVLLFLLGRRVLARAGGAAPTQATAIAAAAALVWAVSPQKSESVAWLADRCTLLQGLTLLGLLLGLRLLERLADAPDARVRPGAALAMLLPWLLGLLSKETALVMPVLLLATHWLCRLRVPLRRALAVYGPLFAVAAAYLVVRVVWLWHPHRFEAQADLPTRLYSQLLVTVDYLGSVVAPFSPRASDAVALHAQPDVAVLAAAGGLAALYAGALWLVQRKDERWPLWGLVWFAVCIGPTSNLLASQRHFRGDRYLYLASFGVVLAICVLLSRLRRPLPLLVGGAFLVAAGWATVVRNREWRASEGDDTAFFTRELAREPHFREALGHLCLSHAERRDFDRAIAYCRQGLAIDAHAWSSTAWQPRSFHALLVDVYTRAGDCEQGVPAARDAIQRYPTDAAFRERLGNLQRRCNR